MGSVIVITSGKGGTGKTSLTGGVGASLALLGKQVLCLDGDVGLRNLDITHAALMDFSDVMAGRCDLSRAAVPHPTVSGLHLLTAPLTLPGDFPGEAGFQALLQQAREAYDYVLIDSPAGLGPGFRLAVCGADRAIVVAVSDPSSLRDAQRVVTQLSQLETGGQPGPSPPAAPAEHHHRRCHGHCGPAPAGPGAGGSQGGSGGHRRPSPGPVGGSAGGCPGL